MKRFASLLFATILLAGLTGCAEITGIKNALLGTKTEDPLQAKQERVVAAQERIKSLNKSSLSKELVASLSFVEQELEEEKARLADLQIGQIKQITKLKNDNGKNSGLDVIGSLFTLNGNSEERSSVTTSPQVTPSAAVLFYGVIRGNAKLRGGPSRKSLSVTTIKTGTKVAVIDNLGDWYQIKLLGLEIQGYIFGDFIDARGVAHGTESASEDPSINTDVEPVNFANSEARLKAFLDTAANSADGSSNPIAHLIKGVNDLTNLVEKERVEFKSPAFQCRSELELCRKENFGYLDCELIMVMCLTDIVLP